MQMQKQEQFNFIRSSIHLFLFTWFIPSPSERSEPRDPKHLRQEMSKTGKRMWSEKEWILGLSQSK